MIAGLRLPYMRGSRGEGFDLPAGKTCGDCAFYSRCSWLVQQYAKDEVCDWSPERFTLPKAAPVQGKDKQGSQ